MQVFPGLGGRGPHGPPQEPCGTNFTLSLACLEFNGKCIFACVCPPISFCLHSHPVFIVLKLGPVTTPISFVANYQNFPYSWLYMWTDLMQNYSFLSLWHISVARLNLFHLPLGMFLEVCHPVAGVRAVWAWKPGVVTLRHSNIIKKIVQHENLQV